jgi:hypothetical protein
VNELDKMAGKVLTGLTGSLSDEDLKEIVPFLAAGSEVPWETSCGMAYGRFVSAQPSFSQPQSRNCPWLDVVWEATIVRCIAYEDGGTISRDEMNRAFGQQQNDMNGLLCELAPLGTIMMSTMIGPAGGQIAAQVQVSMLMSACG